MRYNIGIECINAIKSRHELVQIILRKCNTIITKSSHYCKVCDKWMLLRSINSKNLKEVKTDSSVKDLVLKKIFIQDRIKTQSDFLVG